jgi:hypothetical protein
MKKILAIFLCVGLMLSALESISAQRKPINKTPADTTGEKIKIPRKQIHKQKEQIKKIENKESMLPTPELWNNDRPLLMKEKDSLQNKTK